MKVFDKKKPQGIKYSIPFLVKNSLPETDAKTLMTLINQEQDIGKKLRLSEQLAQCSGVPGLLCYVQISMDIINHSNEDDSSQAALDALSYLLLAERLYKQDPIEASSFMEILLPDEPELSAQYWINKKNEIITPFNLIDYQVQAEEIAQDLFLRSTAGVSAQAKLTLSGN